MNNRVTITHDVMEATVLVELNGTEIKTYPDLEVMDVYGMDIIMQDVYGYCNEKGIELGEQAEIAYVTR